MTTQIRLVSRFLIKILTIYLFLHSLLSACNGQTDKDTLSVIAETPHSHRALPASDSGEDARIVQLRTQVHALHDEAMLVMDDIMELRYKAKSRLHTLNNPTQHTEAIALTREQTNEEKLHLEQVMEELNSAHTLMTDWMRNFDNKMANKTSSEKVMYLIREKATMEQIKMKMLETVKKCKLSLKVYETAK